MERGDIAAVAAAILLVTLLAALFSFLEAPVPSLPAAGSGMTPTVPAMQAIPPLPAMETPPGEVTPAPPVTTRRILYTGDHTRLPVRFLPGDMTRYGFSDTPWKPNSSAVFAYVMESHGGITETFTVPSPSWRMTATVSAGRTPEKARFRMVLVDRDTGQILEGMEIRYPGQVSKTVAGGGRALYMVIGTENLDGFIITLEAPIPGS